VTGKLLLCRGVVVRYLDKHIYVDSPTDVAWLYLSHGSFLADLPVALSGPLQLLALLPSVQAGSPLETRCAADISQRACRLQQAQLL
jgi:hypothetical protein